MVEFLKRLESTPVDIEVKKGFTNTIAVSGLSKSIRQGDTV